MGRRGNPSCNANAESFTKKLRVEAGNSLAFKTFDDVAEHLPRFNADMYKGQRLNSALSYFSPSSSRTNSTGRRSNQRLDPARRHGLTPTVTNIMLTDA